MTLPVINGTNYTEKEKEKRFFGIDAVKITGTSNIIILDDMTVTVYRCHIIKETPFYRCGHPLQVSQSMIEMKPQ